MAILIVGAIIYLVVFSPFFRIAVKQSVIIPAKTVNRARKARKEHNEKAYVLDYEPGSQRPKRVLVRKGSNKSVHPRAPPESEIIIHTHPAVQDPDRINATYATELRERPSGSDIAHLKASHRDRELLMTPSGKLVEYRKVKPPPDGIRKILRTPGPVQMIRTSRKLDQKDMAIQHQVLSSRSVTNEREARLAAQQVNREFIQQARREGVEIREVRAKEPKFTTEVID